MSTAQAEAILHQVPTLTEVTKYMNTKPTVQSKLHTEESIRHAHTSTAGPSHGENTSTSFIGNMCDTIPPVGIGIFIEVWRAMGDERKEGVDIR